MNRDINEFVLIYIFLLQMTLKSEFSVWLNWMDNFVLSFADGDGEYLRAITNI